MINRFHSQRIRNLFIHSRWLVHNPKTSCDETEYLVCYPEEWNTTVEQEEASNVNRVVGYSALYGEDSINKAFDVIEKTFAREFEGCTLTELRYGDDVENRFAEEIEKYHKENNQELIVVLATFDTDENGGDGGFNPNDTYTNWQ